MNTDTSNTSTPETSNTAATNSDEVRVISRAEFTRITTEVGVGLVHHDRGQQDGDEFTVTVWVNTITDEAFVVRQWAADGGNGQLELARRPSLEEAYYLRDGALAASREWAACATARWAHCDGVCV